MNTYDTGSAEILQAMVKLNKQIKQPDNQLARVSYLGRDLIHFLDTLDQSYSFMDFFPNKQVILI